MTTINTCETSPPPPSAIITNHQQVTYQQQGTRRHQHYITQIATSSDEWKAHNKEITPDLFSLLPKFFGFPREVQVCSFFCPVTSSKEQSFLSSIENDNSGRCRGSVGPQ